MRDIKVVSGSSQRAGELKSRLADFFQADYLCLDDLPRSEPGEFTVVDIDLRDSAQVESIRQWLRTCPTRGIFVGVDHASHHESTQAYAIGATCLIPRPIDGRQLSRKFLRARSASAERPVPRTELSAALPGLRALQDIFTAATLGKAPNIQSIKTASLQIVDVIEQKGLSRWLEVIRLHHSQTYQHCLTVTAIAVAFGKHLGFSRVDTERMATAGLLHDIGKASIPVEVLEKRTPLTEAEIALMQEHPQIGHDVLRDTPELDGEMLDMVLHHHEYLDASGYPHALQGNEISDLVRVITIVDVFSALIERRAYKAPLSAMEALEVLRTMGPKLDRALVREFAPLVRALR
jgi:putative nucleotidyltransferase with HDIG domain